MSTPDLHALANLISSSSPNIRNFAIAVADVVQPVVAPTPTPTPALTTHGLGALVYGGNRATVIPDSSMYDDLVVSYADEGPVAGRAKRTLSYVSCLSANSGWWSGMDPAVARANGWILRYPDGTEVLNKGYPANVICDPGNIDYARAWADQVITHMAKVASPAVFVDDNVGSPLGLTSQYPAKYPTPDTWRAALTGTFWPTVSLLLHGAGLYIVANCGDFRAGDAASNTLTYDKSWWTAMAPYLDGLHREFFGQVSADGGESYYDDPAVSAWKGNVMQHLALVDIAQMAGKAFFGTYSAKPNDGVSMSYARGLFMAKWNGKDGALIMVQGGYALPGAVNPWSSSWTWDLGVPLAAMTQRADGLITRAFAKGTLVLNPKLTSLSYNGVTYASRSATPVPV